MTGRLPVAVPAPAPVEEYLARFDDLLASRAQRQGLRDYVVGLLAPQERNKTLTALADAEPTVGATRREVQRLQWFASEAGWDHEAVNERRIELLVADRATSPHADGALVLENDKPIRPHRAGLIRPHPRVGWGLSRSLGVTVRGCGYRLLVRVLRVVRSR